LREDVIPEGCIYSGIVEKDKIIKSLKRYSIQLIWLSIPATATKKLIMEVILRLRMYS
jgi:hypothetical protein